MIKVVRWTPEARIDFREYRNWLQQEAGTKVADAWIDALVEWADELCAFPHLGRSRPEFRANIRTRVFRRNVTIAYVPDARGVTILRMFGRGQNITAADFRTPE